MLNIELQIRNFATVVNNSHLSEVTAPAFLARLKSAYAPLISSPEYISYLERRSLYRIIEGFTKQHDAEALDSILASVGGGAAALDASALVAIFKVQCTNGTAASAFKAFDALQGARQGQGYSRDSLRSDRRIRHPASLHSNLTSFRLCQCQPLIDVHARGQVIPREGHEAQFVSADQILVVHSQFHHGVLRGHF